MKDYDEATVDAIPALAWSALAKGVAKGRDPFHTVTLATTGPAGPEARTVVLRGADTAARTLSCHTDLRSGKVDDLEADPRCAWLFYDRERKLQLRFWGTARVHSEDALARERWEGGASRSRQCYRPLAPGVPCAAADLDVPAADEPDGFEHFAVVVATVHSFDWLYLRAAGHRRAHFEWREESWVGDWIGA